MQNQIQEFFTEEPVAEFLGITVKTLRAMRHRGDGPPYYKLGGSVRYRFNEVQNWAEDRRRTLTRQREVDHV